MITALTIAGSDPSGGAGIQADLKTFHAHGVYGLSVITAVTAQNTQKVHSIVEIPPETVHDQIVCLFDDIHIHAVKIGMIPSISLIESIADALKKVKSPVVVLDPVMASTDGYKLQNTDACQAMVEKLFPLTEILTPNINEAEILTGIRITNLKSARSAARSLIQLGLSKVVVKGGHIKNESATDILYDGNEFFELRKDWIQTANTHGTGCTFSSAVAANLARGKAFFPAVSDAKEYITGALKNSLPIGKGHGPTHHFFDLYDRAGIRYDE